MGHTLEQKKDRRNRKTTLATLASCSHFIYDLASNMTAIYNSTNPASPLAYTASQTALLLLDFQGFILDRCGPEGQVVLAKGVSMRDWALNEGIMVVHSVVDTNGKPPVTCKGSERISKMLADISTNRAAAEEPPEISPRSKEGEHVILKHPGVVSGLKTGGAMELLIEHGIKSLIICGISTSGAVLRTAIPASDDGFVVSVIQDACLDPVDGLHDTLMKNVLPSRAHVTTAEEFMSEWANSAK